MIACEFVHQVGTLAVNYHSSECKGIGHVSFNLHEECCVKNWEYSGVWHQTHTPIDIITNFSLICEDRMVNSWVHNKDCTTHIGGKY